MLSGWVIPINKKQIIKSDKKISLDIEIFLYFWK